MRILAEGIFCVQCEFFEDEENIDHEGKNCQTCGCQKSNHLVANVVEVADNDG